MSKRYSNRGVNAAIREREAAAEAAAKKLEEARLAEEARYKKQLSPRAEETLAELRRMQAFLEERFHSGCIPGFFQS